MIFGDVPDTEERKAGIWWNHHLDPNRYVKPVHIDTNLVFSHSIVSHNSVAETQES